VRTLEVQLAWTRTPPDALHLEHPGRGAHIPSAALGKAATVAAEAFATSALVTAVPLALVLRNLDRRS
jgi:hypothetical protein